MSSTTTNLGLVKMASGETIGQWSDANNGSGANLDKIDTAIGNLNSQMATKATILDKGSVDNGTMSYNFSALGTRRLALVVATNALFIVTKWASNVTAYAAYRESGVTYDINTTTFSASGLATGGYSVIAL